jgi:hypothetical protein
MEASGRRLDLEERLGLVVDTATIFSRALMTATGYAPRSSPASSRSSSGMKLISNSTLADAILARLVHNIYKLNLKLVGEFFV